MAASATKVPDKPAAAGVSTPASILIVWVLGEYGVEIPAEVAAALVAFLAALAYWAAPARE